MLSNCVYNTLNFERGESIDPSMCSLNEQTKSIAFPGRRETIGDLGKRSVSARSRLAQEENSRPIRGRFRDKMTQTGDEASGEKRQPRDHGMQGTPKTLDLNGYKCDPEEKGQKTAMKSQTPTNGCRTPVESWLQKQEQCG
jgi:hypothetical protein